MPADGSKQGLHGKRLDQYLTATGLHGLFHLIHRISCSLRYDRDIPVR